MSLESDELDLESRSFVQHADPSGQHKTSAFSSPRLSQATSQKAQHPTFTPRARMPPPFDMEEEQKLEEEEGPLPLQMKSAELLGSSASEVPSRAPAKKSLKLKKLREELPWSAAVEEQKEVIVTIDIEDTLQAQVTKAVTASLSSLCSDLSILYDVPSFGAVFSHAGMPLDSSQTFESYQLSNEVKLTARYAVPLIVFTSQKAIRMIEVDYKVTACDLMGFIPNANTVDGFIVVGACYRQSEQLILHRGLRPGDTVKFAKYLKVRLAPLAGRRVEAYFFEIECVSTHIPVDPTARIFCREREVDPLQSFAFQGLESGDVLVWKQGIELTCSISGNRVKNCFLPSDSIAKVKLEALIMSGAYKKENTFKVLLAGTPMFEGSTVASCQLTSESDIEIHDGGSLLHELSALSFPHEVFAAILQSIISNVTFIPTNESEGQLLRKGFQRSCILSLQKIEPLFFARRRFGRERPRDEYFVVRIRGFAGGESYVAVRSKSTVRYLKQQTSIETAIPLEHLRLFYAGAELSNTEVFLEPGDTVFLLDARKTQYFFVLSENFEQKYDSAILAQFFGPLAEWKRLACDVHGLYENDNWLSSPQEGGWLLAHHGFSHRTDLRPDSVDTSHCRASASGFCTVASLDMAKCNASELRHGDVTYEFLFESRLNPDLRKTTLVDLGCGFHIYLTKSAKHLRISAIYLRKVQVCRSVLRNSLTSIFSIEIATKKGTCRLEVTSTSTVGWLKRKVEYKTSIPAELQRLFFKGVRLRDEETVGRLIHEDSLRLAIKMTGAVNLKVGQDFELSGVKRRQKVKDLKEEMHFAANSADFWFEGQKLEDDALLAHLPIEAGDTLDFLPTVPTFKVLTIFRGNTTEVAALETDTIADLAHKVGVTSLAWAASRMIGESLSPNMQLGELPSNEAVIFVEKLTISVKQETGESKISSLNSDETVEQVSELLGVEPEDIRVFKDGEELSTFQTFEMQGVSEGDTLEVRTTMPYTCTLQTGPCTVKELPTDSLRKMKIDLMVKAGMDLHEDHEIVLEGNPLEESSALSSVSTEVLHSVQLRPKPPDPITKMSGQMAMMLEIARAVPAAKFIALPASAEQLKREGFQQALLLDPVEAHLMLLARRSQEGPVPEASFSISIAIVSKSPLTLCIESSSTIAAVKLAVEKATKIPSAMQDLVFAATILRDEQILAECGIQSGMTLNLIDHRIKYFIISSDRFDREGDNDFTMFRIPPDYGSRGGEPYYPPAGWIRFGLKVNGIYSDDKWLGMINGPGEWMVTYHGTRKENIEAILERGFDSQKSVAQVFGPGIYSAQLVDTVQRDNYAGEFEWNGRKYLVAFMARVHPNPLRTITCDYPYYCRTPNDRDIRPYGLLVKDVTDGPNLGPEPPPPMRLRHP